MANAKHKLRSTTVVQHGKASTYRYHRCRCAECTEANSVSLAAYRAAHPLVDRANASRYYHRHRELATQRRRAHTGKRRDMLDAAKDKPCADCGIQYPPYVMQFDHKDPTTKLFTIGNNPTRQLALLLAEIDKCDVVCANCHMARTHGERYAARPGRLGIPAGL